MITLTNGLKNSLIVLEYLRANEDLKDIDISVGCFTNCREVGLTFTALSLSDKGQYIPIKYFTWCIYEHRNSDEIIINGKKGYISMNGDLPYNGDSKYAYLKAFRYNEHMEAAQYLGELIILWVRDNQIVPTDQTTN